MGVTEDEIATQLYAVVEAGEAAPRPADGGIAAAEIASVLIAARARRHARRRPRPAAGRGGAKAGRRSLIADDAQLARTLRADGVHLSVTRDPAGAYEEARSILGRRGIVGVDAGISRHDAMTLAEAGAEYIAFGAPPHLKDRDKARARRDELIAWWAEIFEVPCVAFDVETREEAEALARAGADFVAIRLPPARRRRQRANSWPAIAAARPVPATARLRTDPCAPAPRSPDRRADGDGAARAQSVPAAETSSWAGRVDGPAEPAPKKAAGRSPSTRAGPSRSSRPCQARPRAAGDRAAAAPAPQAAAAPAAPAPRRRRPRRPAHAPRRAGHASVQLPASTPRRRPRARMPPYEAFDQGKYLTALQLAVKAAEQGDPQAHTLVGRIYAEGYGAPKNSALAAQWYARGAELGDPEAMFALGVMLAEGQGVAKDREAAGQMFEAAASRKHPLANYNLALLFLKGDGKPENPHRAFAAHAVCRRGRRGGGAIRSGHALRHRHRRRAQRLRGRQVDRQGRGSRPRRGAARLCGDAVPGPRRAARPQARRPALPCGRREGRWRWRRTGWRAATPTAPAWRRTWSRRPSGT